MKRLYSGMTCLSLLIASQYGLAAQDQNAVLSVSGKLNNTAFCSVSLSRTTADFANQNINTIPAASDETINTTGGVLINAQLAGDGCKDENNIENYYAHTALRFTGTADSNNNTVLANTLTGENAAKGIAVGVFTTEGHRISLNENVSVNNGNIPFFVNMVKVSDTPTSGNVQTMLTVSVEHI